MKLNSRYSVVLLSILLSIPLSADITGNIYQDFASDGIKNGTDVGIANVTVSAYDDNGASIASATTDSNGDYTLSTSGGATYRIEVTPPTGYAAATAATPPVKNVTDGTTYDVGLNRGSDFCQADPHVAVTAEPGGSNAATFGSLFTVPPFDANTALTPVTFSNYYKLSTNFDGTNLLGLIDHQDVLLEGANSSAVTALRETRATSADTGSIWGLAWSRHDKKLYSAEVVRRFTPIKDNDGDGIGDAGAIYVTDVDTNATTLLTTVSDTGYAIVESTRDLDIANDGDQAIIPLLGRTGLGDLDISEDEQTLFTVNLFKKELVIIPIATPGTQTTKPIPNPYGSNVCPDDDVRPWALKVRGGDVYIGSVCESDVSVGARVQEYNIANDTFIVEAITNKLNYMKSSPTNPNSDYPGSPYRYRTWNDTTALNKPQPILSDIEFDTNGDLVLGYLDRKTLAGKQVSSGDLRHMCYDPGNGNGGTDYVDETTWEDPTTCTSHASLYEDPATATTHAKHYAEYYGGDFQSYKATSHIENTIGGVAYIGMSNTVITTVFDPITVYSSGLSYFDNETGEKIGSQQLTTPNAPESSGTGVYGGKGGGFGDVEILCDAAPIEIGNYVWEDLNGDGIQDPNEPPIAGVVVKLYENGTEVGSATTDANGYYVFGGASNTNMANGDPLKAGTAYELRIALNDPALGGKAPTVQNANGNNDDVRDSDGDDGTLHSGFSTITYTTGTAGQNDYTLDFGFQGLASIGDTVWYDLNADGIQDSNETGVQGVGVVVKDSSGTIVGTAITDVNGKYNVTGLTPGTYYVEFNLSTLPAGYVVTQQNQGGDDTKDSDADPATGVTASTTLSAGQNDPTWDMGIYQLQPSIDVEKSTNGDDADTGNGPALSVGDTVTWTYVVRNTGNEPLKNIALTDDKEGNVTCPATTLAVGASMTCTKTGTVTAAMIGQTYENKATVTGMGDVTGTTVSDEDPSHYHVEAVALGSVVWEDTNHNGVQDQGEPGIAGAKVILLDASGNPVNKPGTNQPYEVTTGADGKYCFCDLPEGDYKVKVDMSGVSGYEATVNQVANPENNDQTDSNIAVADETNKVYTSGTITLNGGSEPTGENSPVGDDNANCNCTVPDANANKTLDFGFFKPTPPPPPTPTPTPTDKSKISGNVGTVDPTGGNYKPLPGVTLVLFDDQGNEVARTTTDSKGHYEFIAPPGRYTIKEIQPKEYYSVSEDEGGADDDANNAVINTLSVVLSSQEVDIKNDFIESKISPAECSVCQPTICNSCAAFSVTEITSDSVKFRWRPVKNQNGYEIYVNGKYLTTVDKDTTSYVLKNLESDKNFDVKIVALGVKGSTLDQKLTFKTPSVGAAAWLPAIYGLTLQ